jgi:hypothetical protein
MLQTPPSPAHRRSPRQASRAATPDSTTRFRMVAHPPWYQPGAHHLLLRVHVLVVH